MLKLWRRNTGCNRVFLVIAVVALFLCTERFRRILMYTKVVNWDSLWLEPRLKFHLSYEELRDLQNCQYSTADDRCPSYFAWIHEDLAPWNETGLTKQTVDEARAKAHSRVIIVDGKLYYEQYEKCYQTRDDYTVWGLLMLLERFPGQIPDLELYFVCTDFPKVPRSEYSPQTKWPPPPLFVYCTTRRGDFYDIVQPDWSFWAWPEVNVRPWTEEMELISKGAVKPWFDRLPIAYWKGNVWVGTPVRKDLLQCNNSQFNTLIYHQDWQVEVRSGFPTSSLSQQCDYRFKVYAEGTAWSVSLKYITACGSTLLLIEPEYLEFFARSWLPYVHYWPASRWKMCPSLKYAVDWGNAHPVEAEAIGKCGRAFLERELTMEHVYHYMFHLLQGYGKLFKYKPEPPPGLQPMSLSSKLPWHELSINETRRNRNKRICTMPPRDRAAIDRIIARQMSGYKTASQQE